MCNILLYRRQYVACQLGKEMRHKTDMGLVIACVQEWASVLQRKHAAHTFNERNCVRHAFTCWKLRTANTLQAKADALEKEVNIYVWVYECGCGWGWDGWTDGWMDRWKDR